MASNYFANDFEIALLHVVELRLANDSLSVCNTLKKADSGVKI